MTACCRRFAEAQQLRTRMPTSDPLNNPDVPMAGVMTSADRPARLVVSGGGTGGHTYPALTTIDTILAHSSARGLEIDIVWVGTATGLEARVAHLSGISFHPIVAGKLRRAGGLRGSVDNVLDAFRVLKGVAQAIAFTLTCRPDVVFTTGGYAAVPMGIAARLVRRPLVMHEQIHTLGLANNRLLAAALPELLPHCQVVHQSGGNSYESMKDVARSLPEELRPRYHVVEFVHAELADVLAAADVVVSRSGAGTVAELTALGKACILIPLVPTAGDEQQRNAVHLAEAGAARVLSGADATPQRLRDELLDLLEDREARMTLGAAARQHGRPHAAADVARILLSYVSKSAHSGLDRPPGPDPVHGKRAAVPPPTGRSVR